MKYQVKEVDAGLLTCTLRGPAIESQIAAMAKQGWKLEQMEPIVGRCCLFWQRYKALLIFSQEEAD